MGTIKNISILLGITLFLNGQDTPVNLESETSDTEGHSNIDLNWNVWDPSDSYFDAIIYISKSDIKAKFVSFPSMENYYSKLKNKLHWVGKN